MNPGPESPQQKPAAAPGKTGAAAASRRAEGGPSWLLLSAIALVVMVLIRVFVVQSFYVPSGSMEPTIEPGDRILVNKLVSGDALRRGDIIVFDGTKTFGSANGTTPEPTGFTAKVLGGVAVLLGVNIGEQDFVKRIIGMPGDRIICCDTQGRISVNGVPLVEDYIAEGDAPSDVPFAVTVPPGRLWVMGDHRSDSSDSRTHRGDEGGGTIPISDVVGRAASTYWPPSRLGTFDTPEQLADLSKVAAP